MNGMMVHADCGAEVVEVDGQLCDRLMRQVDRDASALGMRPVRHVCRDYVAWHGPADRRDPWTVDVLGSWVPRQKRADRYAPAA